MFRFLTVIRVMGFLIELCAWTSISIFKKRARQNNTRGIVSDILGYMANKIKVLQEQGHLNSS